MKLLYTLLIIFCTAPLSAQIPNGNFETWIDSEAMLIPQGWEVSNTGEVPAVTQDLDANEGMYAMRVEAIDIGLGAFGQASTTFAINEIPPSLDFYVKGATAFGAVTVDITFYNGAEMVDYFFWSSAEEEIEEWTFVSIPLTQTEPVVTTATINVGAFVGDLVPGTAEISVDQMSFGMTTGEVETGPVDLKLYPNPVSNVFRLEHPVEVERIELRDLSGRMLAQYTGMALKGEIDVQNLPPASYVVVAHLKSGNTARQMLVVSP